MAKYFLENIHQQFPHARCGIVVGSRGAMIRDLLAAYPWIEVIEVNRRRPDTLWRLWRKWQGSDLILTQYAGKRGGTFGFPSKLAAWLLCRGGCLIGFQDAFRWNRLLYTHLVPVRPEAAVAEHERAALRAAGLRVPVSFPRLEANMHVGAFPAFDVSAGDYIVMHFFAGSTGRSSSPVWARRLIKEFRVRHPHTRIALTGGPADRAIAHQIAEGNEGAVVLAGEMSLQETLFVLSSSRCVISVDTGIAHMAAHLRKPLIVMRTCLGPNWWFREQYGPDARIRQFSREDLCTPHQYKEHPDCLNKISAEEIVDAYDELSPAL